MYASFTAARHFEAVSLKVKTTGN